MYQIEVNLGAGPVKKEVSEQPIEHAGGVPIYTWGDGNVSGKCWGNGRVGHEARGVASVNGRFQSIVFIFVQPAEPVVEAPVEYATTDNIEAPLEA